MEICFIKFNFAIIKIIYAFIVYDIFVLAVNLCLIHRLKSQLNVMKNHKNPMFCC